MASRKKLCLIDGANLVYRAFYAIRNLSNSKGLPTGALYGFTQMLLKIMRDEKPDLMAVCLDTKEPTFRDELYSEYKANRKEPPDDLVEQFPYVRPIIEALGIAVVEKQGFEADDLIGTLSKKYSALNYDVLIVSGDKDLMQLVDDNIMIFDGMKDLRIGEREVIAKFGVGPKGVAEILSLSGDQSDNIPGVRGIGPKTAETLIKKYGTLEEVLKNVDEIGGNVAEKIRKHEQDALLSRKLVEIDTGVEIKITDDELKISGDKAEVARKLFTELEFTKLVQEIAPSKNIDRSKYKLVQDVRALNEVITCVKKAKIVSLDLETTSLNTMQAEIVGVALAWDEGAAAYIPVGHGGATHEGNQDLFLDVGLYKGQLQKEKVFDALRLILKDPTIKKIGQNLNYDLTILKRLGFEISSVYFDDMLASYILDATEPHGLDAMAAKYLNHKNISYDEVTGTGKERKNFAQVGLEAACEYSSEDADVAFRLYNIFFKKLAEANLDELFHKMEMPLLGVLVEMQLAGVKIDASKLQVLERNFSGRLVELEKKIFELSGESFNVNSPKQLGVILFEKLGLPVSKKTKTGFSTSQDILEELALSYELPKFILEYRSLSKLKSTYVDALPKLINSKTQRVHTSFNQAVTATGRLSSSDPNLQNIPIKSDDGAKIREAFVAEKGFVLLSADYSQIELRVLAHMSKDDSLLKAFKDDKDVHAITASGIFGCPVEKVSSRERSIGKTVNFATIYGQSAFGLSRQLSIDVHEAAKYIDAYFKKYPKVSEYKDEVIARASKEGKVETLFGRRRYFPDINSSNGQMKSLSERMAFNTVFQGTAADIIKRAMIVIHSELPKISEKSRMILQVHDELLFEVPVDEVEKVKAFVTEKMQGAAKLDVELIVQVGVGENWATAH